jgi:hypothetical protein
MPMKSGSTLMEPVVEAEPLPPTRPAQGRSWLPGRLEAVILFAAAFLFFLHFVHLRADFPNHSTWMDWAKYTDEGWYGDAAIRHYLLGHWNVPGDFNPAAALPIWPLLELILFRFTGVSLVAARALSVAVFGLCLVCTYLLARRWPNVRRQDRERSGGASQSVVPALTVLLLVANPFCYVFTRIAIVEPLLILLTLVALLVASKVGTLAAQVEGSEAEAGSEKLARRCWVWTGLLGILLPVMVLTKTTAIFLVPAIFWMAWAATGYRRRPFLRVAVSAVAVGALLWTAYYGLFVRPHFLVDYQYLFSANGYTKVTLPTLGAATRDVVAGAMLMGKPLFGLALAAVVVVGASWLDRRMRANPLGVGLLLWITGYSAFMVYHAAVPVRARYYLVIVVPYTLLVVLGFEPLMLRAVRTVAVGWKQWRDLARADVLAVLAGGAIAVVLLVGITKDVEMTVRFVRHPEYTFVNAAEGVREAVMRESAEHPDHSKLVLSISGSDLSLITGLPSICDDFGTMELVDRVATYRPGWFATWNDVEDDKMDALAPMYSLVRVAEFPAFDDPERNLLILYRLDPANPSSGSRRRGLSGSRRQRTRLGQQPRAAQLQH